MASVSKEHAGCGPSLSTTRKQRTAVDHKEFDDTPKQLPDRLTNYNYQAAPSSDRTEPTLEQETARHPHIYRAVIAYRNSSKHKTLPVPLHEKEPVKIVCVSDTHSIAGFPERAHLLEDGYLPNGDVLIHSGDLSKNGTRGETEATLRWIAKQPHPIKILICGNHDKVLDAKWTREKSEEYKDGRITDADLDWAANIDWKSLGIIYLNHEATTIKVKGRQFKVFGSPQTPEFKNWPFQYPKTKNDIWDDIPEDTDILITHGPPTGHMDTGWGCWELLQRLWKVKPRLHVFGHVHEGHGNEWLRYDALQWAYERTIRDPGFGNSMLVKVLEMWYSVLPPQQAKTLLVNAAVETGFYNTDIQEPTVVWI